MGKKKKKKKKHKSHKPKERYQPSPKKVRAFSKVSSEEIFTISEDVFGSRYYCIGDQKSERR